MSITMFVVLAFGLAMDAFAVSITNGMCYRMHVLKNALASGLAFGIFQGLMPTIGFVAGNAFYDIIASLDHWIALVLLSFIGGRMVWEAYKDSKNPEEAPADRVFSYKTLLLQAVATSIDALAVGVTFGVMQVNILVAASIIALITFACSFAGVLIGKTLGSVLKNKAEILGGLILIFIGVRICAEHLGLI